jgi:putative ABC transport system substrate-binding protein
MAIFIGRRKFIAAIGAVTAWPLAARSQAAMPVIGFLNAQSPDLYTDRLRRFRLGLKEVGYVEGENVAIEYRWAENRLDRLPELAADLVRRNVAVIVASVGIPPALAAKAATTTIPVVFAIGDDPVKFGLVASLARPGGNLTGVNFFGIELVAKRLEILRDLVPGASRVALFVNATNAANTENTLRGAADAAQTMGLQIQAYKVGTAAEIDAAFADFAQNRPDALFVNGDPLFNSRRVQLVQLAAFHRIPAAFSQRRYPEIGGLMSYGTDVDDSFRQLGAYAGRILKGAKPADLPVVQASKFELVINAQTARMLGLTVPPSLLATADEVIE